MHLEVHVTTILSISELLSLFLIMYDAMVRLK